MRASMSNQTSHFGIMGGLYNRKISGRSSTNRVTSRLKIPAGADAGLRYMKMHNLLSRNPLGSGGVGRMFNIRPRGSGLGNVKPITSNLGDVDNLGDDDNLGIEDTSCNTRICHGTDAPTGCCDAFFDGFPASICGASPRPGGGAAKRYLGCCPKCMIGTCPLDSVSYQGLKRIATTRIGFIVPRIMGRLLIVTIKQIM
jgi:hypothetical protein